MAGGVPFMHPAQTVPQIQRGRPAGAPFGVDSAEAMDSFCTSNVHHELQPPTSVQGTSSSGRHSEATLSPAYPSFPVQEQCGGPASAALATVIGGAASTAALVLPARLTSGRSVSPLPAMSLRATTPLSQRAFARLNGKDNQQPPPSAGRATIVSKQAMSNAAVRASTAAIINRLQSAPAPQPQRMVTEGSPRLTSQAAGALRMSTASPHTQSASPLTVTVRTTSPPPQDKHPSSGGSSLVSASACLNAAAASVEVGPFGNASLSAAGRGRAEQLRSCPALPVLSESATATNGPLVPRQTPAAVFRTPITSSSTASLRRVIMPQSAAPLMFATWAPSSSSSSPTAAPQVTVAPPVGQLGASPRIGGFVMSSYARSPRGSGSGTPLLPASQYRADESDIIDKQLSRQLASIDRYSLQPLLIRRLDRGLYEIDGRRVRLHWNEDHPGDLLACEEVGDHDAIPLSAYLSQAANVARTMTEARSSSKALRSRLTFGDCPVPPGPAAQAFAATGACDQRELAMRIACEQARLRDKVSRSPFQASPPGFLLSPRPHATNGSSGCFPMSSSPPVPFGSIGQARGPSPTRPFSPIGEDRPPRRVVAV